MRVSSIVLALLLCAGGISRANTTPSFEVSIAIDLLEAGRNQFQQVDKVLRRDQLFGEGGRTCAVQQRKTSVVVACNWRKRSIHATKFDRALAGRLGRGWQRSVSFKTGGGMSVWWTHSDGRAVGAAVVNNRVLEIVVFPARHASTTAPPPPAKSAPPPPAKSAPPPPPSRDRYAEPKPFEIVRELVALSATGFPGVRGEAMGGGLYKTKYRGCGMTPMEYITTVTCGFVPKPPASTFEPQLDALLGKAWRKRRMKNLVVRGAQNVEWTHGDGRKLWIAVLDTGEVHTVTVESPTKPATGRR